MSIASPKRWRSFIGLVVIIELRKVCCFWEGAPSIEKVHGKLSGLKKNEVKRLSNLYRRKLPPETLITLEFARALASISLDIGKAVSTVIDRRGRVVTVAVGDAASTPLAERFGEAESRLYGVRIIHSHIKKNHAKSHALSESDLSCLFLNRLDAITAIEIRENEFGHAVVDAVHTAQIAPPTASQEDWIIEAPMSISEAETVNIQSMVRALEQEMQRSMQARAVQRSSTERAVLVALNTGEAMTETEARLAELCELVQSAGVTVAHQSYQSRAKVDPKTLIGRGKLQELVSSAYHYDADVLVFDRELNPAQAREISEATQLKVLDRSQVILDIFALNAKGREAQVQVELAQLHYTASRLTGKGHALSRQRGGIGMRGPGETKLELDRRVIRERIAQLELEVDGISQHRSRGRQARTRADVPVIALVGYTNAGKSTLFNAISKGDVLSQDKLFATLRPTTREGWLPALGAWGARVLYTDTVGFIRDLPEELVNAFRATLEELHDADLLLHVIDASDYQAPQHVDAVQRILDGLELNVPKLMVLNKADIADQHFLHDLRTRYEGIALSAVTGEGLDELKAILAAQIEGDDHQPLPENFYEAYGFTAND